MDAYGEPLPEGAVMRVGDSRMRHGGVIYASTLSPDGKTLATAGENSVITWNIETGKLLKRFSCAFGSTFSRPGLAFSLDGTRLGYVRSDYFACVWDLSADKEIRRFQRRYEDGLDKFFAGSIRFIEQGKKCNLTSRQAIETWDVASGKQLATLATANVLDISPTAKTFISGDEKGFLSIKDIQTAKELALVEVRARQNGTQDGVAYSPDETMLATVHVDWGVQLWTLPSGELLATFPLPPSAARILTGDGSKSFEFRLAFSADGRTLLLGTVGGIIHRWDVTKREELPALKKLHSSVSGMHVLPNGNILVSTGWDGIIHRWNLSTGDCDARPESYEGASQAAFSANGRFAVMGDARGRMDLWDAQTGKFLRTLQKTGAAPAHIEFAPGGDMLAVAERSSTVRFWHIPSGDVGAVWPHNPEKNEWFCGGIHFSPDGRLLCIRDYPRQVRVHEVSSGRLLWAGPGSHGEAFSADSSASLAPRLVRTSKLWTQRRERSTKVSG